MAAVSSLGVHTPAAIPYLVAEGILQSAEAPSESYKWFTSSAGDTGALEGEEELVVTDTSVVWSQGGIVRRVYRFEVEGEKVSQALLVWFPKTNLSTSGDGKLSPGDVVNPGSKSDADEVPPPLPSGWSTKAKSYNSQLHGKASVGSRKTGPHKASLSSKDGLKERALVVFLKTQAHVYHLSGSSHIVHLPFEVGRALAAPNGLILQRKISPLGKGQSKGAQSMPMVPPNSFVSSLPQNISAQSSQSPITMFGGPVSSSLTNQSNLLASILPASSGSQRDLPRLFSLTDPLSEMGLIVTSSGQQSRSFSTSLRRENSSSGELDPTEELIYISTNEEFSSLNRFPKNGICPLIIALTINRERATYTIWNVTYLSDIATSDRDSRTARTSGMHSRRRTSYGPGAATGATSPASLGKPSSRASFLGQDAESFSNASTANAFNNRQDEEKKASQKAEKEKADLAATLDIAFDKGVVPGKANRRVSSLIARTDLSTAHDRVAFTDLASGGSGVFANGHQSRRGDSLGSYPRSSFGGPSFQSRRESIPGFNSQSSAGNNSHYDAPVDDLLNELNASGQFEGFGNMGLDDPAEGLKKEVGMTKVESFPIEIDVGDELLSANATSNDPRVFTLVYPRLSSAREEDSDTIVLFIMDKDSRKLATVSLRIQQYQIRRKDQSRRSPQPSSESDVKVTCQYGDVKYESGIVDALKLTDNGITRALVLTEIPGGLGELTLQAPWSPLTRIKLPPSLAIFNAHLLGQLPSTARKREGGFKRVFSQGPQVLLGLDHATSRGAVDVVDETGQRHRLQIQLSPKDVGIRRILEVCSFVLPGAERGGESLLVGWWQIIQWLHEIEHRPVDVEWTALVILLSTMAIPFMDGGIKDSPAPPRKRRTGFLRSSSGANSNLDSWEAMIDQEGGQGSPAPEWMNGASWSWMAEEQGDQAIGAANGRTSRSSVITAFSPSINRKNPMLVNCSAMAIDFLKTQAGDEASGSSGYLPTAASKSLESRRTALATILVGLHLLREDLKLNVHTAESSSTGARGLNPLLAQIGHWLGWKDWSWEDCGYYNLEDVEMERWAFHEGAYIVVYITGELKLTRLGKITLLNVPPQPFSPPSIYEWLCSCLTREEQGSFMTLSDILPSSSPGPLEIATKAVIGQLTPRLAILPELYTFVAAPNRDPGEAVQFMIEHGIEASMLETIPEGILLPLRDAIAGCQDAPPTTWGKKELKLVGRDDLIMLLSYQDGFKEAPKWQLVSSIVIILVGLACANAVIAPNSTSNS
jgi:anaphase-promoting complex subunit 1